MSTCLRVLTASNYSCERERERSFSASKTARSRGGTKEQAPSHNHSPSLCIPKQPSHPGLALNQTSDGGAPPAPLQRLCVTDRPIDRNYRAPTTLHVILFSHPALFLLCNLVRLPNGELCDNTCLFRPDVTLRVDQARRVVRLYFDEAPSIWPCVRRCTYRRPSPSAPLFSSPGS
ncbi:hypothetical protein BKA80DRAFT_87652 [Phyllosticta citrichinensis]